MRWYAVLFAGAWLAGNVAGGYLLPAPMVAGLLAIGLIVLVWRHVPLPYVVSGIALACLGTVYGQTAMTALEHQRCAQSPQAGWQASVEAVWRREAQRALYILRTDQDCRILLTASRWPAYAVEDQVRVQEAWQDLSEMDEEYAGYAAYLKRRGIHGTSRYAEVQRLTHEHAPPAYSEAIEQTVHRLFPAPESGVVAAMTLAQRGMVPEDVTVQFQRTGVSHILAISGLHLSLFAGAVLAAVSLLPIASFWRASVVIAILWAYVWFIQFPVSAYRAAVFWTIALAAFQLRLLISLPVVILTALTAMISMQPLIIQEVGFQLSIAAVSGIGLSLFLMKGTLQRGPGRSILSLTAVSLGAWLATWPLVAYHFGIFSPLSLLANMLVVPVVPLFLLLAIAALLLSAWWPVLALLFSYGVHGVWRWMEAVTGSLALMPGMAIEPVTLPLPIMVGYYSLLLGISMAAVLWQGRSWREVWA